MSNKECPFCNVKHDRIVLMREHIFAIRDQYPVSPEHTLIIPRRHFSSWFDATHREKLEILEILDQLKADIDREFSPAGYNIGINIGRVAGQTVDHLHVHLIPRYADDVDDPRGGVRHVIPEKGNYKNPGKIPICRKG